MALSRYSETYWFPSGILASNVPTQVFSEGNSALAQLWANAAGTIPLPNPLPTDALGVLTFFAPVGRYWVHIDTETFPIDVGMSQEQADLSSGTSSGGDMSLNAGNPKAIDIAPLIGYVVDNSLDGPDAPTIVRVDAPAQTVVLDALAQTRTVTWWLMDSAGAVIQQAVRPTNTQRRTNLVLGVTVYDQVSGAVLEAQTLPVILPQLGNQFADLADSLGPFSISGNKITPNGVNLSFNKSFGTMFSRAFNHYAGSTLTDNPHVTSSPAHTPAQFRRIAQSPPPLTPPVVTTIDPANFDVGGVITPVGGGVNSSTVQRVWLFATNLTANQILVQYGQVAYSSLANAVAAIGAAPFVLAPVTADASLIGYIAVIRSATNLSDPTQAVFVDTGKFSTP